MSRPLIAIPGRFAAQTSALRYGALVNARALLNAVHAAGGEALTVLPHASDGEVSLDEVAERLSWADGVLLPGGGDLDPRRYGQEPASDELYDMDAEQDGFDLAVATWARANAIPTLAVCRGLHVVNSAMGGELEQHMDSPHRHLVQPLHLTDDDLAGELGSTITISCYHHQRISRLADGLIPAGHAADGTIEAVADPQAPGWFMGVQWHPEDTAAIDPSQQAIFDLLVKHARAHRQTGRRTQPALDQAIS